MREDVMLKPELQRHLNVGTDISNCPFSAVKSFAQSIFKENLEGLLT